MSASRSRLEKSNVVQIWREPEFGNAELLAACYRDHHFPPHAHEEYAFGVIERGAQAFQHDRGKRLTMPEGSIGVINPGDVHEGRPANGEGWDYRMIYLAPQVIVDLFSREDTQLTTLPWFSHNVIDDAPTNTLLRAAHCSSASGLATRLEVTSLLTAAVIQLFSRHAQFKLKVRESVVIPRALKRAREFMDANIANSPSLEELSVAADMSPYHLLRQFKAFHGIAPHRYLVQRRVALAKMMLLKGNEAQFVAAQLGYCDQAHLSREFKRFYGVSPNQIRR